MIRLFAIANSFNQDLRWNNMWGWVDQADEVEFDQYTADEKDIVALPLEGFWVEVL